MPRYWVKGRLETLKTHRNDSWEELLKLFPDKSKSVIERAMDNHEIKRERTAREDAEEARGMLKERSWNDPQVLSVDPTVWGGEGARVGFLSGIAYFNQGFRAGLVDAAFRLLAKEGTHFNILIGHIVDGKSLKIHIKEQVSGLRSEDKELRVAFLLEEAAKALAALIPKIKKPAVSGKEKSADEFVRLYIIPSPMLDGEYGERIVQRLLELRPDDIRLYNSGGDKLEVKGVDKTIWALTPKKNRLPSRYYSTAAEKEIDEKLRQTSQQCPDIWCVGGHAASVHIPSGKRFEPYFTIPALRRLEEVIAAENQVGVTVVNFRGADYYSVKVWNYRDLISRERSFVTGIARGADDRHRLIVEVLKAHGPLTAGLLSDKTGLTRKEIEEAMKLLVQAEVSDRKTWPGIHYNPRSQRYDFYLEWIQERLRYPDMPSAMRLDNILFFGCMHAGYTTTDYEFVVKRFAEIINRHEVSVLCGLGDFIAGLHHDFMCSGEVFGQMNNTDQELLAGDMLATVLFRVFEERFAKRLQGKNPTKLSSAEAAALVAESLLLFVYICGNHDLWQEHDGNTPLTVMRYRLIESLSYHIGKFVVDKRMPAIELYKILEGKIVALSDYSAKFTLPSGLDMGMMHPHMGSGATTTLRAQHAIGMDGCQITGVANFHTAAVVQEWRANLGQCVVVQAGTEVLYTRFERRKMKTGVDFGPILLRVFSERTRIIASESAFFNKPLLTKPISKSTNPDDLRRRFGMLIL